MIWHQLNIEFDNPVTAARVLTDDLGPAMTTAQAAGDLHGWWYLRKSPFRLRFQATDAVPALSDLLDKLVGREDARSWCTAVYEPETTAFGGDDAMAVAHALFHADSAYLLARPRPAGLGQRETTVLLASVLM